MIRNIGSLWVEVINSSGCLQNYLIQAQIRTLRIFLPSYALIVIRLITRSDQMDVIWGNAKSFLARRVAVCKVAPITRFVVPAPDLQLTIFKVGNDENRSRFSRKDGGISNTKPDCHAKEARNDGMGGNVPYLAPTARQRKETERFPALPTKGKTRPSTTQTGREQAENENYCNHGCNKRPAALFGSAIIVNHGNVAEKVIKIVVFVIHTGSVEFLLLTKLYAAKTWNLCLRFL